jgi:hypothetical protein
LTAAILFSMPALVFAQATGGCSGSKIIKSGGTKTGGGKKGTAHPELARKGSGNEPKTRGNATVPKVDTEIGKIRETDGGKKVQPTASARKKPPRPAPAKPPNQ